MEIILELQLFFPSVTKVLSARTLTSTYKVVLHSLLLTELMVLKEKSLVSLVLALLLPRTSESTVRSLV